MKTVQGLLAELEQRRDELEAQIRTIRQASGEAVSPASRGFGGSDRVLPSQRKKAAWTPEKRAEQAEKVRKAIADRKAREAAERQRLEAAALRGGSGH